MLLILVFSQIKSFIARAISVYFRNFFSFIFAKFKFYFYFNLEIVDSIEKFYLLLQTVSKISKITTFHNTLTV